MERTRGMSRPLPASLLFPFIFHAILIGWTLAASPVDVARNKKVGLTAEITCGTSGKETYFTHSEAYLRPSSRTLQTCYNTSTHPASAMVDGNADTWWQSTARGQLIKAGYGLNGRPEAIISIDLEQYFEIDSIIISMGDAKRPGRMILYKSVDGIRYIPWIYRVTDERDCVNLYQLQVLATPRYMDSKVCSSYSNKYSGPFEQITFDLGAVDRRLASWRNLRYLKIEFYKMDLTLGINGVKFQHYTVNELQVLAECVCNGQAVSCQLEQATGQYQCLCGGNTTGLFCEQCDPFYNQFEFTYGRPCEECNCFGHADTCFYDAVTANFSRSLDSQGMYRGGGVCNDCRDNTAGVNCNKCMPYYYRPLGEDQRSVNACRPCECHGPGVEINPLTGLTGDCVMNDDTLLPLGMVPGDCICKNNVTGSKCDQCKVGFYNLDANKPSGCTDCGCETRGTVSGSPVCNATTGQCPCKTYTVGKHCDQCMDGYYGMTTEDPDGCRPCECDVGASDSNTCDKETGQCPCKGDITGRQCKDPLPGTYSPDPHFLHGEFESIRSSWDRTLPGYRGFGYATLSESVAGLTYITIPTNTNLHAGFYLLLRYETGHNVTGSAYIFASGVPTVNTDLHFPACPASWCFLQVGHGTDHKFTMVAGKTYTIRVSVNDKLKLDQAVAIPWEFTNGTAAIGPEADVFYTKCDVLNNDLSLGTADETYCLTTFFSMTSYYLGGALPCDCHFLGTESNTTCDPYGGQCYCKSGVGGRRCHDCLLEYWNMQEGGCQPCGCGSDYKVCDSVTGHCVCPPNIVGRKCDQCMFNHWNWTAQHGCEPCECNPIGAASLQCNATTGECQCKPGVQGPKCHTCLPGYKNFAWTGCIPCGCNLLGSLSDTCDVRSGQCPCKENTAGLLCERCKGGTYFLQGEHHAGCLDCVCMGVTKQCRSSSWHLTTNTIPVASSGIDSNRTTNFNIVTEKDTDIMELSIVNQGGIAMAQAEVGSQPRQYWAPIDGLRGNLVALFENTIHFTVRYTAADTKGLPLRNNKLIIVSNYKGRRYYLGVPGVARDNTTEITIKVTDENLVDISENTTRGQLLVGLQDVLMVLIPASYYDRMHTSSIGDIRFVTASPEGEGPPALSVESCSCPAGYEGQSCERCALGYMRQEVDTHAYLGVCRPCECNNHATECDPDTGVCANCKHNTDGPNCEVCAVGYYGSAEMGTPYDCLPCPCYEPRVANGTCLVGRGRIQCLYCAPGYTGALCDKCDTYYYGNPELITFGKCEMCFCHGNALTCDSKTGQCLDCQHQTTGHNCENCTDGFYGNASNHDCNACGCDLTGSRSSVCDHETGQCDCFDGVGGRTCDACLPDYYGFTNNTFEGCMACECNEFGSAATQCNEAGECTCKPNAHGPKCTLCNDGFWGLPFLECQECACDAVGSVDPTAPCESISGQCTCKPGVAGRQCDKCQFLHVGFGENGCTECSECQFSMGNDTTALTATFDGYWTQVQMIGEVQMLDSQMQVIADHIALTSVDLGLSEGHLNILTDGIRNLTLAEPGHNRTVQELLDKGHLLEEQSERLDNASMEELTRQEDFRDSALASYQGALELNTSAPVTVAKLTSYMAAAEQLHLDSSQSSSGVNVNFEREQTTISTALANITAEADQAETMLKGAVSTGNMTNHLEQLTASAKEQLNVIQTKINDAHLLMAEVKVRADEVADSFNVTKYYKTHAEALFMEAQTLIDMTETLLVKSRDSYTEAQKLLDDTYSILHGVPGGHLPVDETITDQGKLAEPDQEERVWSWTQASGKLDLDLNVTLALVRSRTTVVTDMEQRARALTEHVQALDQEFNRVRPLGEQAVEAVKKYEAVAKTLEESVLLALEANRTVGEVMNNLKDVSIAGLEELAKQSVLETQEVVAALRRQQAASEELQQRLLLANTSLTNGVKQWENRYQLSDVFLQAATAIHELAQVGSLIEPLVAEPIEDAYIAADSAIVTAEVVLSQVEDARPLIDEQAQMVSVVRSENNNATNLVASIDAELATFQRVVQSDMRGTLDEAEALRNDTSVQQVQIEADMTALEEKIARALLRLQQIEQPVGLTASQYERVPNPIANTLPSTHTEIKLDFQVTLRPKGVLFFTENNQTTELLKLSIIGEHLTFTYDNGDGPINVQSLANICGGCWFRVIATRYGIDSHLTVIRMGDGALTTSHHRGRTRADRLTLNTPVYVGGLPPNYITSKVTVDDGDFEGCVTNMYIDNHKVALWENALRQESEAQCCVKPPSPPRPQPMLGTFALSGFGYYYMSAVNVSMGAMSHMQFKFRTYDQSGVMVMVDREQVSNHYGLYMVSGKVMLVMGGLGWEENLISARTYGDGQWYQLTAMYNSTYVMLVVEYVDKTISPLIDVRSRVHSRSLDRLQEGLITFGSQNPQTQSRGPVTDFFAACITDVKFVLPGNPSLQKVDIPAMAKSYGSTSTKHCYPQTVKGLSFSEPASYARLSNVRKAISVVQFQFQTYEPSGVIMYAQRPEGTAPYFYIAVFNGDIVVLFNQGSSIQPVLRTRGMYLSDGREHEILIDFSYQNNPRLTVNEEVHHGAVQMTPNMAIMGGPIYLGGVPPTIVLPAQFPVSTALIGGLRNLQINTQLIDLYSSTQLDIRVQKSSWLSGLPLAPVTKPSLPFSTTPAPPTTPHPTCAAPYELSFSTRGMRFGHESESYIAFNTSSSPGLFVNSFTITIEFRAVQPNGILVYAAGSTNSNPTFYFSLFLEDGYLVFNMDSNSKMANANPSGTKRIKSRYTYNTGEWVEVTVLRINDFIALVVTKTRDYMNNGINSNSMSTLTINTLFYVGGVPTSFVGLPFRGEHDIPMGNLPFHGCIKSVKVATHAPEPITFDLSNPDIKVGTLPCFDRVQPGIFFNATNSYIKVEKPNSTPLHNVVPNFRFNMSLHGTAREGALLAAYNSPVKFFVVEIFEGQVRGVLSDGHDPSHPFIFTSAGLISPYALCDNEVHTIEIGLRFDGAEILLDSSQPTFYPYPEGFLFTPIYSQPIYAGGHPDSSWVFPVEVTRKSYHGCINNFFLNGEEYVLAEMEESYGVFSGCPAPPAIDPV